MRPRRKIVGLQMQHEVRISCKNSTRKKPTSSELVFLLHLKRLFLACLKPFCTVIWQKEQIFPETCTTSHFSFRSQDQRTKHGILAREGTGIFVV